MDFVSDNNTTYGPLAQLGERYTGSVEVVGSIPIGSTIHNSKNGRDAVFFVYVTEFEVCRVMCFSSNRLIEPH